MDCREGVQTIFAQARNRDPVAMLRFLDDKPVEDVVWTIYDSLPRWSVEVAPTVGRWGPETIDSAFPNADFLLDIGK